MDLYVPMQSLAVQTAVVKLLKELVLVLVWKEFTSIVMLNLYGMKW